jgi:hypothetical protein
LPVQKNAFAGTAPAASWFGNLMGRFFLGIEPGDFKDWDKIYAWVDSLLKL